MCNLDVELGNAHLRNEKPLSQPQLSRPLMDIQFQPMLDWEQQIATISRIHQDLPEMVWHSAGICRQQPTLNQALYQVQH
ncbi:MAG: hypothetical protein WBA13_12330 [Microcoleaceae cyanobacterium]